MDYTKVACHILLHKHWLLNIFRCLTTDGCIKQNLHCTAFTHVIIWGKMSSSANQTVSTSALSHTCAARSEPARSIIKRRAKRTSCRTSRQRLCCLTATCSTAWERDDVWLAAVGSCVRCLLPFISNSMIWKHVGTAVGGVDRVKWVMSGCVK